ncbi:MAG: WG repeat-containing protein, partial [Phycisphaerae bacterium]
MHSKFASVLAASLVLSSITWAGDHPFPVMSEGKAGFADRAGKIVVPYQFEDAVTFREGLARVKQDGKWGFVDATGTVKIAAQLDTAADFYDGLAHVCKREGLMGHKCGFVDIEGKVVVGYEYTNAGNFSSGLACVEKDGKWGFI